MGCGGGDREKTAMQARECRVGGKFLALERGVIEEPAAIAPLEAPQRATAPLVEFLSIASLLAIKAFYDATTAG